MRTYIKIKSGKKWTSTISIIIQFLIIINIVIQPSINSQQIIFNQTICSNGTTLYVGDNEPGSYETIQSAIDDAIDGDTIYVYDDSSPYNENILITKSLNIIGENRETTIINGAGNNHVIHIEINNVNISSFTIINSGNDYSGISVNSDNNIFKDNIIYGNGNGIRFDFSNNNVVSSNKISDNIVGIYFFNSYSNEVYENLITDHITGIKIDQVSQYNTIFGNTISDSNEGIYIKDSSFNNIYWNNIENSNYGIYFLESENNNVFNSNNIINNRYGIYFEDSSNNKVNDNNIIAYNIEYGILFDHSTNNNIQGNDISNNEIGIKLDNSNNNDIYWNDVEKNSYGIYIYYSDNIDIYLNNIKSNSNTGINIIFGKFTKTSYNNFIKNEIPAYFKQNLFARNTWRNNYWDDLTSLSSMKIQGSLEGIINRENWTAYDFRPAREPYEI